MSTPSIKVSGGENCQTIDNIVKNFISQRHDKSLSPLRLANITVSEFSTELANHLSVLNEGGSIAFGRGEDLASIRLSKSLEGLFSTSTPSVREGPPLTWTRLVLSAGPQFKGPAQLKVEDSSVELSGDDFNLLRSGRPWRFLSPWPDKDDCMKEVQSSKTALQELVDTRRMIDGVLEQISLVEQHLRSHNDLVSQLFEHKDHTTHQGGGLHFDGAQPSVSTQGVSCPGASAEDEGSGYQDSPSLPTTICYASNDRSAQPVNEDLNDLPEDAIARNNLQRDGSWPGNDARSGFRLHTSDFIQSLSELLDDPKNGEVMRWSEDGQSVFLTPESNFPAHLLTRLSTKSYQTLVRRLYYYGFHKIGGAYRHDSFIRGQPSSIRPTREISYSPALPSTPRNSIPRRPRYKVIKRRWTNESW